MREICKIFIIDETQVLVRKGIHNIEKDGISVVIPAIYVNFMWQNNIRKGFGIIEIMNLQQSFSGQNSVFERIDQEKITEIYSDIMNQLEMSQNTSLNFNINLN